MLSDSPPERDLQWTETGITASFKFINKLYDLVERFKEYKQTNTENVEIIDELKNIINEVTNNIESFQFNKSVAKIYEYVNILNEALLKTKISKDHFKWSLQKLSIILQPFVPHISEEMWSNIGGVTLCVNESWPLENVKKKTKLKIAIQINGKTKEVVEIDDQLSKEMILKTIKNNNKIKKQLINKKIVREIYVPGKIVNLVVQ